ncbi:MAG: hypothetical protein GY847_41025 [Proteobacteria bacterium]|nr:hypothetical protein [Pseudomonadota bacterium]
MTLGRKAVVIVLVVAVYGCIEGKSYITKDKSNKVAKYLMDNPPDKMDHVSDANLDGKVLLLGFDLNKDTVEAGGRVEVTWYWQCKATPGPGWRIFTHVFNAEGRSKLNRDKVGIIRKHFQPEHWKPGLVIRDIQKIRVPKDWKSDVFELKVGIWKGRSRMPGTGKSVDIRNRIQGPRVTVRRLKNFSVKVPFATTVPVIDGKFSDEAAWSSAAKLDKFGNTMSGTPAAQATEVRLMWDDKNLYVAMHAVDKHLKSQFKKHDDELWKEDAFEIFLDPLGDKKDYYELQVSPAGIVFDSHLPTHRKNQNEWTSNMKAKVELQGKLNDDEGEDTGWTAELMIPFASLSKGGGVPPKSGNKWRGNFFRVDSTKDKPQYSAWSPPLRGDFHSLDKFGELVFKGPKVVKKVKGADDPKKAEDKGVAKKAKDKGRESKKSPKKDVKEK